MNEKTNTTARPMLARASELTVSEWGAEWLRERDEGGYRHVADDRRRWSKHVAGHAIATLPLRLVTEPIAREWLHDLLVAKKSTGKPLAANTCRNALNLLRTAFTDACEAEVLEVNPFHALRIPRARSARTEELSTVLTLPEQAAFLYVVAEPERWIVAFAMGTGLRQSEQWAMRRAQVQANGVLIGSRTVPLFGIALAAMTHQNALLDARGAGPEDYVWPAPRGGPRDKKPPRGWRDWLKLAGISRRVRWHDLRHTCAASLVSGWWGRAWSLEEVRELLGHSSITITERYAHFSKNVLRRAAEETIAAQAGQPHLGAP